MSHAFVYGIGPLELTIVLVIVLLILGPKRLPSLGRQLGSGMREFGNSIRGRDDTHADVSPSSPAVSAGGGARAAGERSADGEGVPERR